MTGSAEAGVYICLTCRDDPDEECGDYCEMEHLRELPSVALDYWPRCECCGEAMHLRRPLIAVAT